MGRTVRRTDAGFTLVEIVVALSLVTTVLAATGTFLVRTMLTTHHQNERQHAAVLASAAMEHARSLSPGTLVSGRDATSVGAQWAAAPAEVSRALSDTEPAVDSGAAPTSGSAAAIPTTPIVTDTFSQQWYVGRCWVGPDDTCTDDNRTVDGSYDMHRFVVAVSWASSQCGAAQCWYVVSTLVADAEPEPLFGTAAPGPATTP